MSALRLEMVEIDVDKDKEYLMEVDDNGLWIDDCVLVVVGHVYVKIGRENGREW